MKKKLLLASLMIIVALTLYMFLGVISVVPLYTCICGDKNLCAWGNNLRQPLEDECQGYGYEF
jgi:hypothetical protein